MTQALATAEGFEVRPAVAEDELNCVRKSWVQEHAQASDWIDHVGGGTVYFAEHVPARDAAMQRGAVLIAYRPSVPSGICGWAVTEERDGATIVHFVYVKPRWRRLGVARLLLRPLLDGRKVTVTHETYMAPRKGGTVPWPRGWTFNPYPFLRST